MLIRWFLLVNAEPDLGVFPEGHILTQQRFWSVKKELRGPGDYRELNLPLEILFFLEITRYSKKKPSKYINEWNRGVMGLD